MPKEEVTIKDLEKRYKEWALGLLKARFDLKPEAFDEHHKDNFSYESCVDALWFFIKPSYERLLELNKEAVVLYKKVSMIQTKYYKAIMKLVCNELKSEDYRLYGADGTSKHCVLSYDEIDNLPKTIYQEANKNG